jgi:hypothetical protein
MQGWGGAGSCQVATEHTTCPHADGVFAPRAWAVGLGQVFEPAMASTNSTSVVLTRTHRDALFHEIEFAFEAAGGLPFMLERAAASRIDSEDARDLVIQLQAAVGLLDQIGWERTGDRDDYVIEVDEAVNAFAARIESFARAALEYNGQRVEPSAAVRRLIDADLEKLQAARILRSAHRPDTSLSSAASRV